METRTLILSNGGCLKTGGKFTVYREWRGGYAVAPDSKVIIVFGDQKIEMTESDLCVLQALLR